MAATDFFGALPKASESYDVYPPEHLADADAGRQLANSTPVAAGQSIGLSIANLGTKAVEGIKAIGSRFGDALPFSKAGAMTPAFNTITTPQSLSAATNSIVGSSYTADGLALGIERERLFAATVPSTSASAYKAATSVGSAEDDKEHIVTLKDSIGGLVEFLVMPEIVENRNVQYEPVSPAQFPGAFQKYKGTDSVQWSVNAMFVARTSKEAKKNFDYINLLRSWSLPFFGELTAQAYKDKLGAPPCVLKFKGFRSGILDERPVVITSLSWNWPRDVDYIPMAASPDSDALSDLPFPTVISVAIQLVESWSTTEFNQFSLKEYRAGNMVGAFGTELNTAYLAAQSQSSSGRVPIEQEAQTVAGQGAAAPDTSRTGFTNLVKSGQVKAPAISEVKKVLETGNSFVQTPIDFKRINKLPAQNVFKTTNGDLRNG